MPSYLFKATYTTQGLQGMLREGPSSREDHLAKLTRSLGGKLEAFYFAFGETDVYAIAELPDNETAAALAMTIGATGAVGIQTVVLMTPKEADKATRKSVEYRPPGT